MNYSVLMVCTGNICRSPMAQGLLAHMLPEHLKPLVSVRSAGTQGLHGNMAAPHAIKAVSAYGADISAHRARILDTTMVKSADLVLAMERYHLDQINRLRFFFRYRYASLLGPFDPERQNPEIEDPYGEPLRAYEACAREIAACMPGVIAHIQNQMASKAS